MAGTFEYTRAKDDVDEICGNASEEVEVDVEVINESDDNVVILDEKEEEEEIRPKRQMIYKPLSAFGNPKWTQRITRDKTIPFEYKPVPNALNEKKSALFNDLKNHSPSQLFELYFDKKLLQHIRTETNRYAQQQNSSFNMSLSHLRRFIGILIVSGYHTLPSLRDYWSNQPSLGVQIVKQAMTSNQFAEIKRFIHFCNNDELDKNDKLAKVI